MAKESREHVTAQYIVGGENGEEIKVTVTITNLGVLLGAPNRPIRIHIEVPKDAIKQKEDQNKGVTPAMREILQALYKKAGIATNSDRYRINHWSDIQGNDNARAYDINLVMIPGAGEEIDKKHRELKPSRNSKGPDFKEFAEGVVSLVDDALTTPPLNARTVDTDEHAQTSGGERRPQAIAGLAAGPKSGHTPDLMRAARQGATTTQK